MTSFKLYGVCSFGWLLGWSENRSFDWLVFFKELLSFKKKMADILHVVSMYNFLPTV